MILADIKSVGDGVIERLVTPQIRTIMQRVAVLLRPAQPRAAQGESALQILELAPDTAEAPVPSGTDARAGRTEKYCVQAWRTGFQSRADAADGGAQRLGGALLHLSIMHRRVCCLLKRSMTS